MPERIFLTGGSGFVGRNLIRSLIEKGYAVRALARSDKARATVEALGAKPARGDISDDSESLSASMKGCRSLIHSAAWTEDWGDWKKAYEINVEGTRKVLSAAISAGLERAVHVSTEAVLCDGSPIIEADEQRPVASRAIGIYPRSKALAEGIAIETCANKIELMITRPRFIWGRDDTTLLPRLQEAARSGQLRWINGGRYKTSTCHVANACAGTIAALERGLAGQSYFLTDGPALEFRAHISAMLEASGVTAPSGEVPRWLAAAAARTAELAWSWLPLPGRPAITRTALKLIGEEVTVSDARARAELGYKNVISVDEGLAELREIFRGKAS